MSAQFLHHLRASIDYSVDVRIFLQEKSFQGLEKMSQSDEQSVFVFFL